MAQDLQAMPNQVLSDPREFVPFWFKRQGLTLKPNGEVRGGTLAGVLFDTLWLDYEELYSVASAKATFDIETGKKVKLFKVTEKNMEKALNEFMAKQQAVARAGAMAGLEYNGASDEHIGLWLASVTGARTQFQIAILKHVLWQVKRKVLGLPVLYHLCPMFFGKQNGGKSTAVFKLFSPFADFTIEFKPEEACDPRNAKTLQDNFVCIFDEMAGMGRVEMEALKRVITADSSTYRPLHTNRFEKVRQNTTFIGISNKSLQENIYDTTGIRRFMQFQCLDVLDWKLLESVDVVSIWRSVDESLPAGYVPSVSDQLKEHQAGMVMEDDVGHFLREMAVVVPADGECTEILGLALYDKFLAWRSLNGYANKPGMIFSWFGSRMATAKVEKKARRVDGKEKTFYRINKDSHVFAKEPTGSVSQIKFMEQ